MIKRLTDLPVYSSAQTSIEADLYNTIRIATQRLPLPIRLPLPRFRYIDIIIDQDSWACVDRNLNDLPIIAWTEFDMAHRSSLHLPSSCKIAHYHFQSSQVAEGVLSFTKITLKRKLALLVANTPRKNSSSNISLLRCILPHD